jgi:hypothetical protein
MTLARNPHTGSLFILPDRHPERARMIRAGQTRWVVTDYMHTSMRNTGPLEVVQIVDTAPILQRMLLARDEATATTSADAWARIYALALDDIAGLCGVPTPEKP